MSRNVYRIELQIPYGTLTDWRETYSEDVAYRHVSTFLQTLRRTGKQGFVPVLFNGVEIPPHTLKQNRNTHGKR